MRHTLSLKDPDKRTAECAICGPVKLANAGNGKFQCAVAKRVAHTRWLRNNPEKAAANRRSRSEHHLTDPDPQTMTATCAACQGLVGTVPWGRGYACGVMASARRSVQDVEVQSPCSLCRSEGKLVYPTGGVCPRCSDREHTEVGYGLMASEHRGLERRREIADSQGLLLVEQDLDTPRTESAVPGWRTLGSGNAESWWAANAHLVESDN